ncbi:MAG TPA: SPOR domain-containing protein [Sphingomicrobium sp.]|nr:SPOR domain-containing protein [Sphingomicrobium sp.]
MKRRRAGAMILASAGLAFGTIASAAGAQAVPVYAESSADALARNVKILADSPRNFDALVAAGKAALRLGDTQAAAGFFGRAEEVNPQSPLPKAGMGAALVATGDPNAALIYFTMAQHLGASVITFGCDRGLAYDLLGNQAAAQADYRAALNGPDRDEARRRLALSLAISGDKPLALQTLNPLMARRDVAAHRVRALVLALGGDVAGAKAVVDFTMPGTSPSMEPFFRRLPSLADAQKAAAVHLGIFPESTGAMASAQAGGDRLASIEQILRQQPAPPAVQYSPPQASVAQRQQPRVQTASVPTRRIARAVSPNNDLVQTRMVASEPGGRKIWLQLASGKSVSELPGEFDRIRSRKPSLFTGIAGYVAEDGSRPRLVIGPFHSEEDARLFADALSTVRISARRWVSRPGQVVRELSIQ